MITAVIDRIEAQQAVILVGDDEKEFIIPLQLLPIGAKDGDWIKVEFSRGVIIKVELDPEQTVQRKDQLQAKLAKLKEGKGSKFKRE